MFSTKDKGRKDVAYHHLYKLFVLITLIDVAMKKLIDFQVELKGDN